MLPTSEACVCYCNSYEVLLGLLELAGVGPSVKGVHSRIRRKAPHEIRASEQLVPWVPRGPFGVRRSEKRLLAGSLTARA